MLTMAGGAAPLDVDWTIYWQQHARRARHYDLLGTCMTILMLTSNVWRSSMAPSSYSTPEARASLRNTQAAYAVAIILHVVVLFMITQRPRQYLVARQVLTCGRWLSVSGIILASTMLPVFQAGAALSSSDSQWWLLRWTGLLFRSGAMFCVIQFLFYHMPWPHMAGMACTYLVGSSVLNTRPFCQSVVSSLGSQQLHADFSTTQSTASLLDCMVGQGQYQQEQGQGGSAGAALPPWQSTAGRLGAVCDPQAVRAPALHPACTRALLGQCQATVTTVKFALTYLLLLLMITLERYSKWCFLQQQHQQQHQHQQQSPQHARTQPPGTSDGAGSIRGGPPGTYAHVSQASHVGSTDQGASVFADPYRFTTAWEFLRVELLKLVVLADVPVLLCWFVLSSVLRPLPVEAA